MHVARPIPRLPPVTKATLPFKSASTNMTCQSRPRVLSQLRMGVPLAPPVLHMGHTSHESTGGAGGTLHEPGESRMLLALEYGGKLRNEDPAALLPVCGDPSGNAVRHFFSRETQRLQRGCGRQTAGAHRTTPISGEIGRRNASQRRPSGVHRGFREAFAPRPGRDA